MSTPAVGEQTTLSDRKRRAGQRLVVGFAGDGLNDDERAFIARAQPAGFIWFARNVVEPAQVRELNRELVSLSPADRPPLLGVDQEGGRVQRVRDTAWPRARWLGNIDSPELTAAVYRGIGAELRAMGFNLNFAPDADVDSNPANPVIGDRSFGSSPAQVARHVRAAMDGLHQVGVSSCVKHFPGHGDTNTDSHLDLPIVEKEPPDLARCELLPFESAVAHGAPMVMTAHVVFPAWDEHHPATMSRPILHGQLRERLGFSGVICSDDMEMKAVRGRYPLDMQLDLACRATVDLFLVCESLSMCWEAFETLVKHQESDKAHDALAKDSARRVHALRERFLRAPPPAPELDVVGGQAHRALALDARARGEG